VKFVQHCPKKEVLSITLVEEIQNAVSTGNMYTTSITNHKKRLFLSSAVPSTPQAMRLFEQHLLGFFQFFPMETNRGGSKNWQKSF